jgi:hypothetical protein
MPSAIVKAKKDLLNHSKANIENEDSRYWGVYIEEGIELVERNGL